MEEEEEKGHVFDRKRKEELVEGDRKREEKIRKERIGKGRERKRESRSWEHRSYEVKDEGNSRQV